MRAREPPVSQGTVRCMLFAAPPRRICVADLQQANGDGCYDLQVNFASSRSSTPSRIQ